MKAYLIVLLIISGLIFSCSDIIKEEPILEIEHEEIHETPAIFEEKNYVTKLTSSYERSNADVISELYDEAMEKSTQLKQLNDLFIKIPSLKNDSLVDYNNFSQTNSNYWQSTENYINQLTDTNLRKSTLEVFKNLEIEYETSMSNHEQKLTKINEKSILLHDQLILMKLFVTQPMMLNYQTNEKPNIETLESLIDEYDKLIKETEVFVKL